MLILVLTHSGCAFFSKKKESLKAPTIVRYTDNEYIAYDKIINSFLNKIDNFDQDFYNHLNYESLSSTNESLLHAACLSVNENYKIFDEVLSRTKNIDQVSVYSKTPLTFAIERNDLYKTKSLLSKGANVDHLEFLSNPIFFIPIKNKNIDMLRLLISFNFNPTQMGFMNRYWKDIPTSVEISSLMKEYDQKFILKMQEELAKPKVIKSRNLIDKIINAN